MNEIAAKTNGSISWPGPEVLAWPIGAALVVTADVLLWQHVPGISLFLFYVAIVVAVLILCGRRAATPHVMTATGIAIAGALPLIETLSWTGFLSATFGVTILALASSDNLPRQLVDLPGTVIRFGIPTPVRLIGDTLATGARLLEQGLGRIVAVGILNWLMPLILAGIFVLLFAAANPLIDGALSALNPDGIFAFLDPWRVTLWGFALAFAWPFLVPKLLPSMPSTEVQGPQRPKTAGIVFGPGAILRALLVFNVIFAVQSVLDIAYLWGGVRLPDGMTYADYAHRGAYPLVATALLAAVFVLLAMRPNGAVEQSLLIRRLVYLFIAQNVLLVISSILRLDLYVEVYTLTELRVAAGIWMGLVAIGLLLILARIALRKSNKWLVATNVMSLGLTLYAVSFVDVPAFIARFNVEHSYELTGNGSKLDIGYLWRLGPSALPALDDFLARAKDGPDHELREVAMARNEVAIAFMGRDRDWRSWTFRDWRSERYILGTGYLAEFPDAGRRQGYLP